MVKVLVIGASGLVGSRFTELNAQKFDFDSPSSEQLDILNSESLEKYLERSTAEVIINFAAYTNVDEAEEEKDNKEGLVYKLNVEAPKNLAVLSHKLGKYFIHISTDYVFGGEKEDSPYTEEDKPNPVNWYGMTKYLGEQEVLESDGESCIVRPEVPYRAKYEIKKDLARTFIDLLKGGKQISAVSDQKITPVFIDSFSEALVKIIDAKEKGIYHVASTNWITPYDFARLLAGEFNLDSSLVVKKSFDEFRITRKAMRPKNSWIDVSKFNNRFGEGILKKVEESVKILKSQMGE